MQAWVEAVPLGIHHAPQGELHATRQWVADKVKQLNEQFANKIKFPVPWGHQKAAAPGEENDEEFRKFATSRYNAGYITGARVSEKTGGLSLRADVPGASVDGQGNLITELELANGTKVKGAISEVSVKVVPSWKDGNGRVWKDSLYHCALVPLPVVMGQPGFELSTAPGPDETYLGRSSLIRELGTAMPFPPKADDDDLDDDESVPDAAATDAPAPAVPDAAAGGVDANFTAVITGLTKIGLHIAPGTTPENLVERLAIALHQRNEGDAGDADADADADGGEASGGGGGDVVEEQRPIMMSTLAGDAYKQKLFGREQDRHRRRALRVIDRLAQAQIMPVTDAARLRETFGSYELSTTPDGDDIPQTADLELSVWQKVAGVAPQTRAAFAALGTPAPRPDKSGSQRQAEQEAAGDELAALAGAPAKK